MITLENLLNIIKFGLQNLHLLNESCKKVNVKDITLLNEDTLCCSFLANATNSNDIKLEMAPIIGFFNGFFRDNKYEGINLNYYAVRAFNKDNEELLNALCTKSTAELIGKGNSIEWLKLTLFQENTADYRLAQAKQIISEIENGLREIVKVKLNAKFGEDWWNKGLNNKLGKEVKETYSNQFGDECNDGNTLIAYTYTLQLKKIILTHFNLFISYFSNQSDFESLMDKLNKIRREEAHNRNISTTDLETLKELHEKLTSKILLELVAFQSVYLTENWRLKIKRIMVERQYSAIHEEEAITNEANLLRKLVKIKENLTHLISYVDETIIKLKSITTPVHKKELQRELVFHYEKFKELQELLLAQTDTLDNDKIKTVVDKINAHKTKMDEFSQKFLMSEN